MGKFTPGRSAEARTDFELTAALTENARERAVRLRRAPPRTEVQACGVVGEAERRNAPASAGGRTGPFLRPGDERSLIG